MEWQRAVRCFSPAWFNRYWFLTNWNATVSSKAFESVETDFLVEFSFKNSVNGNCTDDDDQILAMSQYFFPSYEILCAGSIPKGFQNGKEVCQKMVNAALPVLLDSHLHLLDLGQRTGTGCELLSLRSDEDLLSRWCSRSPRRRSRCETHGCHQPFTSHLSWISGSRVNLYRRTFLPRPCLVHLSRNYQRRIQRLHAIRVIQRNGRALMVIRNWKWWRLFTRIKPLLQVTRIDDELAKYKEEIRRLTATLEARTSQLQDVQKEIEQVRREYNQVNARLAHTEDSFSQSEEVSEADTPFVRR